jgi:hypothetical protein
MYQLQVAGGGEGATFAEGATSVPDISVTPSGMIDFLLNTPGVFPGTHTIPVTVTSGGQTATTNVTVTVYPYTLKQSSVTVQPETNNAVRLAFSSTGTPMPSIMSFTPEGSAWATDGLSLSSEGVITGTPSSTFESGTPLQVGIMFEQVTQGGTKLGMKLLETINLPVTES